MTDKNSLFSKMKKPRHFEMFEEFVLGSTLAEIAEKHKVSRQAVKMLSKKYGWSKEKSLIIEKEYSKTIRNLKLQVTKLANILDKDASRIIAAMEKNKKATLTKEERLHLRSYFDRILKEVRLDDGKPTGDEVMNNIQVNSNEVKLIAPPQMASALSTFFKSKKTQIISDIEHKKDSEDDEDT